MKSTLAKIGALLAVSAALISTNLVRANEIDYANTTSSVIKFDGSSHFSFNHSLSASGHDFQITSTGAANGLLGDITGTYTIGAVTTIGGLSTASVTGTGSVKIYDGVNTLTGTLVWNDIEQFGTGDSLNTIGSLNLTSITYAGSNTVLQTLAGIGSATDVLTFQFTPAVSLANLKAHSHSTSYSGSISTIPDGGTTLMLMGFALSGLALIRRKRA